MTNDLTGKATTKTPITVTTDPNTHVDLLDKDNHVIGSGTTDSNGRVTITPTVPIPEVMYALKRLIMRNIQTVHFLNRRKRLILHRRSPIVNTDLTGKGTTEHLLTYLGSEHRFELPDKDNHVIGLWYDG